MRRKESGQGQDEIDGGPDGDFISDPGGENTLAEGTGQTTSAARRTTT